MNVPDFVEGYPNPRPPKWLKIERFDRENFKDIDDNAKQVTVSAETTFEQLISKLTSDLSSDLQKVRAIFVWLGSQDIDGNTYTKISDTNTPLGFMKLIKEKTRSYVQIFAVLCRESGLPCVIVRGAGKAASYEVGDQDVEKSQSAWNAVFVDGSWQIVHPYWAFVKVTGHETGKWTKIEDKGKEIREKPTASEGVDTRSQDETYFLPNPQEFIHTCIAKNTEWQLLESPWDMKKFCNVPQLEFSYFSSNYKIVKPYQAIIHSVDGKCEIELIEKEGTTSNLTYSLFFDEAESSEALPATLKLPRSVFFETNGTKLRILVRFYVKGVYKLSLTTTTILANFRLEAKEKCSNTNILPVCPAIGFGFGHTAKNKGLKDPSHKNGVVVTQSNQIETFSFTMVERTQIITRLKHVRAESNTLDKYLSKHIKGNNVSIKVNMPDDSKDEEYALQVFTEDEREDNNVLNYLLTNRKKDFENLAKKQQLRKRIQEDKIRRRLESAVVLTRTKTSLEQSINAFEEAQLSDTSGNLRRAKTLYGILKDEEEEAASMKQIERRLRSAVKQKDLDAIDEAVKEAERVGFKELEDLVAWARDKAIGIEQEEIRDSRITAIRDWMKKATENKDMEELEQVIAEFQVSEIPDISDLKKAKTVLRQLYEKAIEDSLGDLKELEDVLQQTQKSILSSDLQQSKFVKRGKSHLHQQKRMKGPMSKILKLNNSTVTEIQMYKDPRPVTRDILKAAMIILGSDPRDVEKWSSIQKCLKPSGEVLRKIRTCKKKMLHRNTVKRARELLDQYTIDDAREVSAGVAAFYTWCNEMVGDDSSRRSDAGDTKVEE